MPKTKISEFSATPGNNTDIDGINIAEGCAPSGINDAIRELMAQLKDFQAGTAGDSFNGPVGTTTAAAGAFTTLSASSTVSGAGFSTYLASPPAIGGTAAAAGSFTTLTTSSTVTHNGGTANGVAYLNGSKVLTTGSALTFDGTNFGVGTASYGNAGAINAAIGVPGTTAGGLQLWSTTTASHFVQFGDGTAGDAPYRGAIGYNHTADGLLFYAAAAEGMRLTSTGLGIGTSSPAIKLDVRGSGPSGINVGESLSASTNSSRLFFSNATAGQAFAIYNANNALVFTNGATAGSTTGSEVMRLDSSGNLGIGTSSPAYKLDVVGPVQSSAGYYINGNASGGYIWVRDNYALRFGTNDTERMRLDSSGNLGLGVTPSAWADYKALQTTGASFIGYSDGASNNQAQIVANAFFTTGSVWKYIYTDNASRYMQYDGQHLWFNAPSGTAGNTITFTQAMTLTAAGGLVVGGTADPGASNISAFGDFRLNSASYSRVADLDNAGGFAGGYNLYVDGTTVKHDSTGAISGYHYQSGGVVSFFTGSSAAAGTTATERARITSGGELLVNTTTANGQLNVAVPNGTTNVIYLERTGASTANARVTFANTYTNLFTSDRFQIEAGGSGGVYLAAAGTSWTAVSDERKKDIIEPIANAAQKVSSLRAVIGKYKTDTEGTRRSFLIAQDVQAVLPEAVDTTNSDELGLSYSDVIPLLAAAIKEQQVMINELKAKVAALEAK